MLRMPTADARVNENGQASRHLEVTDAQLRRWSAPAGAGCGALSATRHLQATTDLAQMGRRKRPRTVLASGRINGPVTGEELALKEAGPEACRQDHILVQEAW